MMVMMMTLFRDSVSRTNGTEPAIKWLLQIEENSSAAIRGALKLIVAGADGERINAHNCVEQSNMFTFESFRRAMDENCALFWRERNF